MAYKKREELAEENKVLVKENKEMQSRLDKMEEMMKQLMEAQNNKSSGEVVEVKEEQVQHNYDDDNIGANEYIKVISLVDNTLNLTTEMYGKGKVFTFTKFGQSRSIQYHEVAEIIHNQEKFLHQGLFVIADDRVIRRHQLEDTFGKILDRKTIERIVASDDRHDIDLFIAANDKQKDVIIDLFIKKNAHLPEDKIDYNKVKLFSNHSGKDVEEMMKEYKTLR